MLGEMMTSSDLIPEQPSTESSNESLTTNERWLGAKPVLSVVVPTYRDSANQLTDALSNCALADDIELIIYDDGSGDIALTGSMKQSVRAFSGAACLVTAYVNKGRSAARNRLQSLARAKWLLFLDADMIPDSQAFLSAYIEAIRENDTPRLIVGGFSLKQTGFSPETAVHRAQSEASECVPADIRALNPARYVFTSNVLAHKAVMENVGFDPAFNGWGWEDVDWGVRVAERYDVQHIENTATHLGLDPVKTLIRKYGGSGENFWLALNRHPEVLADTSLAKLATKLSGLPGLKLLASASKAIASSPAWLMPLPVRVLGLKLYRAAVYGGTRHART